jgi:predicted metal-binding membrane protein
VNSANSAAQFPARERAPVPALLALLIVAGWAWLLYQDWAMHHMDVVDMAMPGTATWNGTDLLLVFVMWAIMMAAMMLPTALPMILAFAAVTRRRSEHANALARTGLFVFAYLLVWTGFSAAATLAQWGLHSAALISPMMIATSPLLGAVLLIATGIYQLTPFKRACLAHCQSPLDFLLTEWRDGGDGALMMGVKHGAWCTGCCWLLMTVLFVVGVMNLWWIAAITLFVLLEKLLARAEWLRYASSALLIAWGTWLALAAPA